jgi:hypothetical protein
MLSPYCTAGRLHLALARPEAALRVSPSRLSIFQDRVGFYPAALRDRLNCVV